MEYGPKDLKETAFLRNRYMDYKGGGSAGLAFGLMFIFFLTPAIYFAPFKDQLGDYTKFALILPVFGVIAIIWSLGQKKKAQKAEKDLYADGSAKVVQLESLMDKIERSEPENDPDVFSFHITYTSQNVQRQILWFVKSMDEFFVIVNVTYKRIYILNKDELKILKWKKPSLTGKKNAEVTLDGKKLKIYISDGDYVNYTRLLAKR